MNPAALFAAMGLFNRRRDNTCACDFDPLPDWLFYLFMVLMLGFVGIELYDIFHHASH